MLLNLLLLVLTSVAAVGGSVNVMENYEEQPAGVPEEEEEEEEEQPAEGFYQYVKKEKFENANATNDANANAANAPMNGPESFQAQVNSSMNNAANANANMNNTSIVEGFTGGSFAAF